MYKDGVARLNFLLKALKFYIFKYIFASINKNVIVFQKELEKLINN